MTVDAGTSEYARQQHAAGNGHEVPGLGAKAIAFGSKDVRVVFVAQNKTYDLEFNVLDTKYRTVDASGSRGQVLLLARAADARV
jgi:hypothetical protein